ncbi:unnamed protein product, partial [Mesorhabditis belari]|uniref:Uncharacterized protein n=1 Tax=Mesorhabditis belari TaxID=2138241 RepID=A0AAF3EY73_9BILA
MLPTRKVPLVRQPPMQEPLPFDPKIVQQGLSELHIYPTRQGGGLMQIEVTMSFGLQPGWITEIERSVVEYYTGDQSNSGQQANNIAEYLERKLGGFWSVMIVDDPGIAAFTVSRKPIYAMIQVNGGEGILISSSGVPAGGPSGISIGSPFRQPPHMG